MHIATVAELRDAFGGNGKLGEWASRGDSTISMWIARGRVPPAYHRRLEREAAARGWKIADEVFGEDEDPPSPIEAAGAMA